MVNSHEKENNSILPILIGIYPMSQNEEPAHATWSKILSL